MPRQIGVQHLDGDVALVLEIRCEIDRGHAAGAELTGHAVEVREGGGETGEGVGHGPNLPGTGLLASAATSPWSGRACSGRAVEGAEFTSGGGVVLR